MRNFYARGGQFWLDDQPQLIQAGEFHYYRTPQDQWPHRLGLLKAAGFNAVASYMPWLWHQLAPGVADFDGHSHPMRNLAGYLDLAAEMGLLIIARPGPYIMAETINEGVPPWVFERYPQAAFVNQDGQAQNVVSYLHPDFLACVREWYKAIFAVLAPRQITRDGRIVMVQLDNEMGMIQWVRNIFDTNPDTVARFAAYLRQTYGARLYERYPAAALDEYLHAELRHPQSPAAAGLADDYRAFYRQYLREYAAFLLAEARANGLETPPVINIHGFANGGKTFAIGISQLIAAMEIDDMLSATDVYPGHIGEGNFHQLLLVNEMTKSLHNPQQPLFSIEFQAGGNQDFSGSQSSLYDLHSRLCISSGMRAINHYLFFDGENDPILSPVKRHDWGHPVRKDGTLRSHYPRYQHLSKVLTTLGADLTLAQPQSVTTVGYLLDDFMTEVNNPFSQPAAQVITHQRDVVLFDLIARGLALTQRPFDAIELARGELDAVRQPLLWVMMDKQCNAAVQQKLVDYLRRGGRLILAGRICEQDFSGQPCTLLKDAIGIQQIASDAPFTAALIQAFQYEDVPVSFMETYTGSFAEIFARSAAGETVGFIQRVGAGKVMVLGAAFPANTLDDLDIVHQMALVMGCPPAFTLSHWADVRLSRGENGSFLFVNNYQDDPIETTIHLGSQGLFGGQPLHLPARRGLILPLEWQARPGVLIHYITSEILAIRETPTTLTIQTAQDRFSAELTLSGFVCAAPPLQPEAQAAQRIQITGSDGAIVLSKV